MRDTVRIRRALISVHDKTGVVEFARALHAEFGVEIISTGGTARTLKDGGIPVTLVEQITGCPEILDGRVKTLHPKIHAAILADRDNPEHLRQLAAQGIEPIDLVAVNLYPFEQTVAQPGCTLDQAIEMIDIGGPCLLRAAAKNYKHVLVLHNQTDCERVLTWLRRDTLSAAGWERVRRDFSWSAFELVSRYDAEIARWLSQNSSGALHWRVVEALRYGENPQQTAWVCQLAGAAPAVRLPRSASEPGATVEMSFNNHADANAAFELCAELTRASAVWQRLPAGDKEAWHRPEACATGGPGAAPSAPLPAVCFIKHTNPCGAAVHADPLQAYRQAYLGDPNAAMGGILAVNFVVNAPLAEAVMETYQRWGKAAGAGGFFLEVWLAPAFDAAAVQVIRTAKEWGQRVRLLSAGDMRTPPDPDKLDLKPIAGGLLVQTRDLVGLNEDQWQVVTQRPPTQAEMADLRLAWLICKHTRSNAVTVCKDGMLIANGAGQMSRVMSCRIATWLARENGHADQLRGAVAASDAFFPFRDGPDLLMNAGITALIQPGGSKRDQEVIDACNMRAVAMIFTGTRHFRH